MTAETLLQASGLTDGALNISGFTFKDDPTFDAALTYPVSFSSCLTPATVNFSDNTILGTGNIVYDWGLLLGYGSTCSYTINNNEFDNIGGNSILVELATGPVEIGNNDFILPNDGYPAIFSMSYGTASVPNTVTGLHWYHDNNIYAKAVGGSFMSGIVIAPAMGQAGWNELQYGSYTNVLIEDNIVEGFQSVGIQVEVDGENSTFKGVIQNNTLTAYPGISYSKGIRLLGPVSDTSLLGNIITNGYRGIFLSGTWGQPIYPTNITIEKNQLAANTIGFEEQDTVNDQDASPNWWGSASGPAAGYVVSNLNYIPWCLDAACTEVYGPVKNVTRGTYFGTIQAAIDDAATVNGDVITVAAGTYEEYLVIDKELTIRGPNYDINPITETRAAEALIKYPSGLAEDRDLVDIFADNVTFSGFTLDGQDLDTVTYWGEGIYSEANNLTVKNNIVKNFMTIGYRSGASFGGPYYTGILVENNNFTCDTGFYYSYAGIYLQGAMGNVRGNMVDCAYRGIQVQPYTNLDTTQGVVENNVFKAYRSPLYFNYSESDNANWLFQNNDLFGIASPEGSALPRWDGMEIETFKKGNVEFTGNEVQYGATDADMIYPFGIINWPTTSTGTVDLEDVYANNTFERVAIITDGTNIIKTQPDMAFYSTIQDAVDAAVSGNTVEVSAGTYTEQVTITKDITLLGAGKTLTTIQAFPSMPVCFTTSKDHRPVVCVKDNATARINGFTIDGLGLGNANVNFEGVAFRNAGGTLQNSLIKDIRDTPFSGTQHGVAVYVYNDDATARTVHVLDNVITGFQKNAMALNASATNPLTVDVQRNTITGAGSTAVTAQNGIQVDAAAGGGLVQDNVVTGITYDGSGWVATSILIFNSQDLDTRGNTITDAHMGIYYIGASGLIDDNTLSIIEGAGYAYGIVTDGGANVLLTNNEIDFPGLDNSGSVGIEIDAGYDNDNVNVTVGGDEFGNVVTGFDLGLYLAQCDPATYTYGCGTGSFASINIEENNLMDNVYGLYLDDLVSTLPTILHNQLSGGDSIGLYSELSSLVNAEANWWGSMFGPDTDMYVGDVDFIKWCGDEACTFLLPDDGGVIEIESEDPITETLVINQPGLTIILADGTTIEPTSGACFEINADSTKIFAETNLGAVCAPETGFNGIDVADGLTDIRIKGIDFSGANGGEDGINFSGEITHLMILDNWFHGLAGDGIYFATAPAGTISIQGNLFQDNVGLGINNVVPGTTPIPAAYNSWGHYAGAVSGDGVSAGVTSEPWTHVDLYFGATGVGSPVTYTVYGNLQNVMGASFTLKYPEGLILGSYDDFGQFSPPDPLNPEGLFTIDATDRTISFNGYVQGTTPISGESVPLFYATFTGSAPGGVLDLMEDTDSFSMPTMLSSNIYAARLLDGTIAGNGYTVTGYVWMQGRGLNAYAGIPGLLTGTNMYGPYSATTIDFPADNLVFAGVAEGNYIFTTNQPRYLNIPASMDKTVFATADTILPELLLIGGNAVWTDNVINSQDAGKVGRNYLKAVFEADADVNFDNVVNLLDLTMVGGNYTKTNLSEYGSWTPPTP